ncbi:hypothetical protein J0S82_000111, partial [Galemys pyrenaicus]
ARLSAFTCDPSHIVLSVVSSLIDAKWIVGKQYTVEDIVLLKALPVPHMKYVGHDLAEIVFKVD